MAAVSQRLVAPRTWLGSERINVLQVLCDLLDLVQLMNVQLAEHTHVPGPTPGPSDSVAFTAKSAQARELALKLKTITI